MSSSGLGTIGLVWLGTFVVISAASSLYFWFGENAEDKRQLYPWAMVLSGGLFLGFAFFAVQMPLPFFGFFVIIVLVSTMLHIRQTTFCPKCARMIYRGRWLSRVAFCPRCGHALDAPEATRR